MTEGVPPEGNLRTFLIGDVRGYTRFTAEHGDAAAAALATTFAALARDATEARSGRVIELRGDEVLAVFASTAQAVRAALELQTTCAEETAIDPSLPLLVGIGIAAGEPVPVEDGYRGVALNLAARLCSTAAAGEVNVSAWVADLAGLDHEVRFLDRGTVELKGFPEPVAYLSATKPDGRAPFIQIGSPPPGGLPVQLDTSLPMVGREHEMRWARGTLRQARRGAGRVVFVSGQSGIGKTRLAAQLALEAESMGAVVRYAGAGGTAVADMLGAIGSARTAAEPTLVVLDDLDAAGDQTAVALAHAVTSIQTRPVMVMALVQDPGATAALASVVERVDERGDGHRPLGVLDPDDVREVCRTYAGDDLSEAPLESIARSSGGVPGRIHELASEWAHDEASRRLTAAAEWFAAGRERRTAGLGFANNVIGLKLDRLYRVPDSEDDQTSCPYMGLASFRAEDAGSFFGREALVGELAARIVGVGLLGVIGASGSGKTSLLAAGLRSSLAAGLLPGSASWRQVAMRPGEHPMAELRRALDGPASGEADPIGWAADSLQAGERLVLIVDQFEEIFTTCSDPAEADAFVDALVMAGGDPDRAVVVLALRGDFYGRTAEWPALAEALSANHVLVGPMSDQELRRAIELPARRGGLRVESALLDRLVSEVADAPGGLPLLSTTLVELWGERAGGWLRLDTYERTGGIKGAVARLAEQTFDALSPAEGDVARAMFLRLVGPGEGDAITRRRVPLAEFDLDADQQTADVMARFLRDRLLTADDRSVEVAHEALLREWPRLRSWLAEDAQGRELRAHLTTAATTWHEAGEEDSELYRGARLSTTLDWAGTHDAELNEQERRFLTESRRASEREGDRQRRANRRLRGLLAGVAMFLVLSLVGGSIALIQRGKAQHAATVALSQSLGARAIVEPRLDTAMLLGAEAANLDPSTTAQSDLLTTLLRVPTVVRTFRDTANRLNGMALSPDGRTLAMVDDSGHVVLESTATGRTLGAYDIRTFNDIAPFAFAPNGTLIRFAVGSDDRFRAVLITDTLTGRVLHRLSLPRIVAEAGTASGSGSIILSRNGRRLAAILAAPGDSSGPSGTLLQWRLPSGRRFASPITLPGDGAAYAASYLPGGTQLLISGPHTEIMNAATGKVVRTYPAATGLDATLSPDERIAAFPQGTSSVEFLDLTTGRMARSSDSASEGVGSMVFTPDGKQLLTGSTVQSPTSAVSIWDVGSQSLVQNLDGPAAGAGDLAVSPDGDSLYASSFDTTVTEWDLSGARGLANTFQAARSDANLAAWNVAMSPDGRTVAVGDSHGVVHLWDTTTDREIRAFKAVPAVVTSVSFGPDGKTLLVSGITQQGFSGHELGQAFLRVWSIVPTPRLERSLVGMNTLANWAAISPDGSTAVAIGFADQADAKKGLGQVAEWSMTTGAPLAPPMDLGHGPANDVVFAPHGTEVATVSGGWVSIVDPARRTTLRQFKVSDAAYTWAVAFSPDGAKIATGDFAGFLRLWDPHTGKPLSPAVTASQLGILGISWNPSGTRILTVGGDATARLYDASTLQQIGPAMPITQGLGIGSLSNDWGTFSADGSELVLTDASGRVWIYPATLTAWKARACAVANSQLSRADWARFLPGRPYRDVCPSPRV